MAREAVVHFVQESIANAVDRQKRNADKHGRANVLLINVGDLVLLSTVNLPKQVVTNVGSSKLLPKHIGSSRVLRRKGNAYTIELPRRMRTNFSFMSVVSTCTITTRSLPRANKTATLKNLQEILVVPSQLLNLALQSSILATKVIHFVAKGLPIQLVLQLVERELLSFVRSIKADALHQRLQRETLLPLLFGEITQIAYALLETTNLRLQLREIRS